MVDVIVAMAVGVTPISGTHTMPDYIQRGAGVVTPAFNVEYGDFVIIDPPTFDTVGATVEYYFYAMYYERIWTTPNSFVFSNPRLGMEFDVSLWNAFSSENSLIDVDLSAVDGIEYVFDIPISFRRYEFVTVTFNISNDAPATIDGNIVAVFTKGQASIHVVAKLIEVLKSQPEIPVNERWQYLTTTTRATDGTEQRMSLRDKPKLTLSFTSLILSDADRVNWIASASKYAGRTVSFPLYQYGTRLTNTATIGTDVLELDTSKTKLNIDDYIALFNEYTDAVEVYKVIAVLPNSVQVDAPLDIAFNRNWLVAPCVDMLITDGTTINMQSVSGELSIEASTLGEYNPMRANITRQLTDLYDNMPVILKRPAVIGSVVDTVITNVTVIDYGTSKGLPYMQYPVDDIERTNTYISKRGAELDYWRNFADTTRGSLKPFLVPTYRNDLPVIVGTAVPNTQEFTTSNIEYAGMHDQLRNRRLMLDTSAGIILCSATGTIAVDGGVRVVLNTLLPDVPDLVINSVSIMYPCRISNDMIELEHNMLDTTITFKTVTLEL